MRYCENCGAGLYDDATHCTSCGAEVATAAPPQEATAVQGSNPSAYARFTKEHENDAPMSLGDWLITVLVSGIPCVGFIMLLVWAFSSDTNVNRKNYCRAVLILGAIGLVLSLLFSVVFSTAIENMIDWLT